MIAETAAEPGTSPVQPTPPLRPTLPVNVDAGVVPAAGWRRLGGVRRLRLGGVQTAFSASLLLMGCTVLAQMFSLLRNKLVAHYFGADVETAAYFAGFQLPDMIYYLVIGGVASTAFVTILTRYRDAEDEAGGDRALSAILNVVFAGLLFACVLGFVFAPQYVAYFFAGFTPHEAALCVHMTRILMVTPLLHFAGGVFASRLLVRKIFITQAIAPVFYSGGIVVGLLLLHNRYGIDSMAIGAVAGAFFGPLLVNFIGARRVGLRWSPTWNPQHPAVREWLLISLPLMLGASLTTTDPWIRNKFISGDAADMSLLNYARQIFTAPMNALGPAAGIASLPFFAALWVKRDVAAFSAAVDRAVSRMIAVSLLLSGWMIGIAPLIIDILVRGGKFNGHDAAVTSGYFVLYTLGLFLWTSQNLYARAFYAASDTLTPMVSGTAVTLISIPLYRMLYLVDGSRGLVWAATLGMLLHTGALATLLHRKRMVSLAELEWPELGRALLAAVVSGAVLVGVTRLLPERRTLFVNLLAAMAETLVWVTLVFAVLRWTGSRLPDVVLRRKRTA